MSHALGPRRLVGAVAVGVVASIAMSGTAPAGAVTVRSSTGLFGSADPTFDGAYRQSMALLGLSAAKAPVPASAVSWLIAQQCADGSYQAYRADPAAPCAAPDPKAFSGPDSNSTALAAMALATAGRVAPAQRAVASLLANQNGDGGWSYYAGGASDVDSTALALAAIKGTALTAASRTIVTRGTAYLKGAQIACTAAAQTRFALPYQPGQPANPLASAQGLIGMVGPLPATTASAPSVRTAGCTSAIAQQLASYLDRLLRSTKGAVPDAFSSGKADWNATATAVIGLAGVGGAGPAVSVGLAALRANTVAYTGAGATASPAALGTLIQAAVVGGDRPRRFGDTHANLVVELLATLQK